MRIVLYTQLGATPSRTASELNGWLRAYFRSPAVAAKEIRALLDNNREEFYTHAVRVMRTFDDSPGARFLVILMLDRGLLLRAFSEPAFPEQRVRNIIQALLAEDDGSDLALVKAVVDQAQAKSQLVTRKALLRVLNNLERLTDARRIAPRLLPLLRHPDPHLRSKAVRIIGCCGRNTQWVARQLTDPDPRTRANALEALWGLDGLESRDLLKGAAQDANNRVAGNALLGLYRAGDASSIAEILKMAAEGPSPLRATAAWAMGESGDPRFKDALKALAAADNANLRERAALSLHQVEAEAAKPNSAVPWRMAVLSDPPDGDRTWKRLRVAVHCADGGPAPAILPTQFSIIEGKQPVVEYGVESLEVPEKLALAFVIPVMPDGSGCPIVTGALRALAWKRPQDAWAAVRYKPPQRWNLKATLIGEIIEIAPPDEIPLPVETPVFVADREGASQALRHAPEGAVHSSIWDAIFETNRACSNLGASHARHLVIYSPCDFENPAEQQLQRMSTLDLSIPVHCIARSDNPFLKELCERSKGAYRLVATDDDVVETLQWLCIRPLVYYQLGYEGAADAVAAQVHVRTPEGCARAAVKFRRE